MLKENKIFVFVLFLLLINFVIAQDEDSDDELYDYDSYDSYQNADFYLYSDPSQWDYNNVNWDMVDFNRPEIYTSQYFYRYLPYDRYDEVDYLQIDYIIVDHSRVDSDKYLRDLRCIGCSFSRGDQDIRFSGEGITHPNGDYVSIPGNYPSGTLFIATEYVIEVLIPEGTSSIDIPSTDDVTIDTKEKEIVLSDGTKISGRLSYKDGQAYVKAGDELVIGTRRILQTDNDVNIYLNVPFDASGHEDESYYYAGDKDMLIHSKAGESVKIEILAGDELFNTFERKYIEDENGRILKFRMGDGVKGFLKDNYGFKYKIVLDEGDLLKISVEDGDVLEINEKVGESKFLFIRDKKEIPLMTHLETPGGRTIIESGENTFILTDKLMIRKTDIMDGTESVAFQLKSNSIPEGHQLRVGSENLFAVLEPDEFDSPIAFSSNGRIIRIHPEGEIPNGIVNEEILKNHQKYMYSSLDDLTYLNLLEDGEFILPKEVMDAYGTTVDPTRLESSGFGGGYLQFNYLNRRKERGEFIQKMRKLGLNDDDIAIYYAILRRPNTIIISSNNAQREDFFKIVLPHERMHKAFKDLSPPDRNYMGMVVEEVMFKSFTIEEAKQEPDIFTADDIERMERLQKYIGEDVEEYFEYTTNIVKVYPGEGSLAPYIDPNYSWEELFTYMAGNTYYPQLEKYIKREYPKAYEIYEKIRKETFDNIKNKIEGLL